MAVDGGWHATRPGGDSPDCRRSKPTCLVILIIGAVLLYYGLESADSWASHLWEVVHNAPTNQAITWIAFGAITPGIGAVLSPALDLPFAVSRSI